MSKPKIIAIVGSLRKQSFNLQLAQRVKTLIQDRAEFEILDYSDIPFFNQDIEIPAPDSVTRVRNKIVEADGVWIFTPEYNHYFPAVLKNVLDWLSRPFDENIPVVREKPLAISGVAAGGAGTSHAQDHLVAFLSFLNMDIMNMPRLTIPGAFSLVDANGVIDLSKSETYIQKQVDAFLEFIKKRAIKNG